MFKSTAEFDSAMNEILKKLCNGAKISELDCPDDESDRDAAIIECIHRGYISGVTYGHTQDGKAHFSENNMRVTHDGLSFMESF